MKLLRPDAGGAVVILPDSLPERTIVMPKIFIATGTAGDKMFFNISANVGPGAPNKAEDVQLVQFGYFAATFSLKLKPELKVVFSAVVPGANYTGAANDPLTLAIKADQAAGTGTKDGVVSVLHGGVTYVAGGRHTFLLISLVNDIRKLMGKDFPRLDKHAKCPAVLAAGIRNLFDV